MTTQRLTKKDRDELRRAEIVAAARKCVAYSGFHAASMAEIARTARMSVGHLYRYFENKESIIRAIVEMITEEQLNWIASTALNKNVAEFQIERFTERFVDNREERALLLEMHAEAARNPDIAAILENADQQYRKMAALTIRKIYTDLEEEEIIARVELMATISESFLLRSIKAPEAESARINKLLEGVIGHIWPKI
ncbi:TetR/AcrR family transcriptional regulator [Geobacter sp. FeAm09]|uniref:TetR/AcrR family transcriptional regulator n=1 Tax=Geobacter sp. FeAm09 TaxID=2597769 RepID=UPI0011F0155A|nr:TetR/AcrR family transcriptional regulator [Geobacter sp. FeAm09]QEM67518.1 TetR/AcrR family transcriptional regulator [Geobacter sp. FeAm09]